MSGEARRALEAEWMPEGSTALLLCESESPSRPRVCEASAEYWGRPAFLTSEDVTSLRHYVGEELSKAGLLPPKHKLSQLEQPAKVLNLIDFNECNPPLPRQRVSAEAIGRLPRPVVGRLQARTAPRRLRQEQLCKLMEAGRHRSLQTKAFEVWQHAAAQNMREDAIGALEQENAKLALKIKKALRYVRSTP
mmetsp:Transcript_4809/g.8556  ORF Transcript_4809/g.8556 Transcript_4809/m.8556 type:complete len:192 (-) Transcript_4809:59-634(-)